jgi:hypothetical protein
MQFLNNVFHQFGQAKFAHCGSIFATAPAASCLKKCCSLLKRSLKMSDTLI